MKYIVLYLWKEIQTIERSELQIPTLLKQWNNIFLEKYTGADVINKF